MAAAWKRHQVAVESPAQRCAIALLGAVFGALRGRERYAVGRVCKSWRTASLACGVGTDLLSVHSGDTRRLWRCM
jgi:hypothetical protein